MSRMKISKEARYALRQIPFVTESKIIAAMEKAQVDPSQYTLAERVGLLIGFDHERGRAFVRAKRTGHNYNFEGFPIAEGDNYREVCRQYEAATGIRLPH